LLAAASQKLYRLPGNLRPYSYVVFIQPFFDVNTIPENYNGSVKIYFRCLKDTNKLMLHIRDLVLHNATLHVASITESNYPTSSGFSWQLDEDTNVFTAEFDQARSFKANHNYTFYVEFQGFFRDDNTGLYKSSYKDTNMATK
jgi:hypothetical protein